MFVFLIFEFLWKNFASESDQSCRSNWVNFFLFHYQKSTNFTIKTSNISFSFSSSREILQFSHLQDKFLHFFNFSLHFIFHSLQSFSSSESKSVKISFEFPSPLNNFTIVQQFQCIFFSLFRQFDDWLDEFAPEIFTVVNENCLNL